MSVSFTARIFVGFLVDHGDLFVDTSLPPACPSGHAPKAGEAFCPVDGGRFEAKAERSFRAPVAACLERYGLKVDAVDLDGWLYPRKGYEDIVLFDARAHAESGDRGGKMLALGYPVARVDLNDRANREPRSFWLSQFQADADRCRRMAAELGIGREVDVQMFLTGYTGY